MTTGLAQRRFNPFAVPQIWREFASFALRPRWMEPAGLRAAQSWQILALMLVLHLAVLAMLMPLLTAWQKTWGLSGPDAFGQVPKDWLVPFVVLIAPVLEECAFRGWLTGRPRGLWLLAMAIAGFGGVLALQPAPLPTVAVFFGALLAAPIGWLVLRKRQAPRLWRGRWFAVLFHAVALLFAAMHVTNYAQPGLLVLPLVLPQLWAAYSLGYIRMRVGLAGSILVHATSNGLALALALASG